MSNILQNIDIAHLTNIVRALKNSRAMARAKDSPTAFFAEYGINLPPNKKYEIHINDEQTLYFVVSADALHELSHETLTHVTAAAIVTLGTFGSVSSALCAFSYSTTAIPEFSASTLSTALTALGTASTVARVDRYVDRTKKT